MAQKKHDAGLASCYNGDIMGTKRVMIKRCRNVGLDGPEFALTDGFVVTVRRKPDLVFKAVGGITGEVQRLLTVPHPLVGTNAYQAIGTRIGVRLPAKTMTTDDIDIATGPRISVAVPMVKADIPAAIDSLKMGFFPVPSLNHKHPSTTFAIRNKRLRLDIITPKTTASDVPVFIPRFNCAATPLPYLSYVIEAPMQALIIDAEPVLVNVPQPARYAFHKLVVSQVRDMAKDEKAAKDLLQAHELLSAVKELRPADIKPAWEDLLSRGPKWKKHAQAALTKMQNRYGKVEI